MKIRLSKTLSKSRQMQWLKLAFLSAAVSLPMMAAVATAANAATAINSVSLIAQASTTGANSSAIAEAASQLQDYYNAINARDYTRAYADWFNQGEASGQSFSEFKQGFANTASTSVEITGAGRIEGAAGSSYTTLPVTITSTTTARNTQKFSGTYTLRRLNDQTRVPVADQGWHIFSADLSASHTASAGGILSGYSAASAPYLSMGDRGKAVQDVQTKLQALNLDTGGLDGNFGPRTRQAVIEFQRSHQLTADGIMGPKTWAAMIAA